MKSLAWTGIVLAVAFPGAAAAQTTLPLNTGYNHGTFAPYGMPAAQPSTISDAYWIKIASYEPGSTPAPTVSPAWVLNRSLGGPPTPWAAPMSVTAGSPPTTFQSQWIGPRPVVASSPGSSATFPAYSLFRKCFCLMPGYSSPRLSFTIRGDDTVQVWLNNVTNTLVGPTLGNWGGTPLQGGTSDPTKFRPGPNCIYVLLEDFAGHMGFNLAGTVSALGLMPVAGSGTATPPSFAPCQCTTGGPATGTATTSASAAIRTRLRAIASDDDSATVAAIIRIAEERRLQRVQEVVRPRR